MDDSYYHGQTQTILLCTESFKKNVKNQFLEKLDKKNQL